MRQQSEWRALLEAAGVSQLIMETDWSWSG